ncbi:Glycerol-3-phosphate acyltransferase, chloroplastic-like protein [Drosera capensis]
MWLLSSSSSPTSPPLTNLLPKQTAAPPPPPPHLRFLASSAVHSAARLDSTRRRGMMRCMCSKLNLIPNKVTATTAAAVEVVTEEEEGGEGERLLKEVALGNSENECCLSRTFLGAESGEDLLSRIQKEVDSGRLPENLASGMEELYQNYRSAVLLSGNPDTDNIVLTNMSVVLDRILKDVEEPYEFPAYHRAVREPFDYYTFGQDYIRPLVDFRNSYVGNASLFTEIEEMVQQGHNIVFISNHQTEADPAIISLLLEKRNSHIAENMTCVAGDRVITDPLCKPFSMGRNLVCVYSKKHLYDVPELVDMKRRANTGSLKEMTKLLRGGSQIIWIAPSGGRDRPNPDTGDWHPAPFDVSVVDSMRRLTAHAGVPGHIFPLAVLCYDIMPPPLQVEKEIGEKRVISFHGTGLCVGLEINYSDLAIGLGEDEAKKSYTQALYDSVFEQYKVLKAAVHGKRGLRASCPSVSLSQPWT